MTTTINASTSSGLVSTADGSGILKVQSNGVTTNALAWVNFNGTTTGTNAPRAGYNISSVTRNGTGDYTINFTNALSDANYALTGCCSRGATDNNALFQQHYATPPATTSCRISTTWNGATQFDAPYVFAAIFGN